MYLLIRKHLFYKTIQPSRGNGEEGRQEEEKPFSKTKNLY